MKLSDILKIEDRNDSFIYFKVIGSHTDTDRDKALVMNGLDGRETYIRVMIDDGRIIAVTFWYTARTPENTLTYRFTPVFVTPDPVLGYMYNCLDKALRELGILQ